MNVPLSRLAGAALLVLASGSAHALFKVVGPDGSVTYTDRPPQSASARVTTLGRTGAEVASPPAENAMPVELRQVATKFPVVLYTAADCTSCGAGRTWLLQRGVPYTERIVSSDEDILALERTVGARSVPALTIGSQVLRGFSPGDWASYVDAAGYPAESKLPRGWAPPAPAPLVARTTPIVAPRGAASLESRPAQPAAVADDTAPPAADNPGGLRF